LDQKVTISWGSSCSWFTSHDSFERTANNGDSRVPFVLVVQRTLTVVQHTEFVHRRLLLVAARDGLGVRLTPLTTRLAGIGVVANRPDIIALVSSSEALDSRSRHQETIVDAFEASLGWRIGNHFMSADFPGRVWLDDVRRRGQVVEIRGFISWEGDTGDARVLI
jgi:hypothetical protein